MVDVSALREGDKILVEMTVKHAAMLGDLVYAFLGDESYSPRPVKAEAVKRIVSYNLQAGDRVMMGLLGGANVAGKVVFADDSCVVIKDADGCPFLGFPKDCVRLSETEKASDNVE